MPQDQVFSVREGGQVVYRVMVDGRVFGDWCSKGAAQAGLAVEQRRAAARRAKALEAAR